MKNQRNNRRDFVKLTGFGLAGALSEQNPSERLAD
jgi:hypothetical protein